MIGAPTQGRFVRPNRTTIAALPQQGRTKLRRPCFSFGRDSRLALRSFPSHECRLRALRSMSVTLSLSDRPPAPGLVEKVLTSTRLDCDSDIPPGRPRDSSMALTVR